MRLIVLTFSRAEEKLQLIKGKSVVLEDQQKSVKMTLSSYQSIASKNLNTGINALFAIVNVYVKCYKNIIEEDSNKSITSETHRDIDESTLVKSPDLKDAVSSKICQVSSISQSFPASSDFTGAVRDVGDCGDVVGGNKFAASTLSENLRRSDAVYKCEIKLPKTSQTPSCKLGLIENSESMSIKIQINKWLEEIGTWNDLNQLGAKFRSYISLKNIKKLDPYSLSNKSSIGEYDYKGGVNFQNHIA